MNVYDEMQAHLNSCGETIRLTKNTLKLADIQAADYDEILQECNDNIRWAQQDLQKVREFLYPEEYATKH